MHYEYMEIEKLYKIQLTGAELIVGKLRWSSDSSWGRKVDQKGSDSEHLSSKQSVSGKSKNVLLRRKLKSKQKTKIKHLERRRKLVRQQKLSRNVM